MYEKAIMVKNETKTFPKTEDEDIDKLREKLRRIVEKYPEIKIELPPE
jgi:uncharacterized membrane protein